MSLTAFHAESGDRLCLEYAGKDGRPRQRLVDGGLGSAFKRGLGTWLDEAVRPKHLDVAVSPTSTVITSGNPLCVEGRAPWCRRRVVSTAGGSSSRTSGDRRPVDDAEDTLSRHIRT